MEGDPFTIWVFLQKLCLNAAALLAIGLAVATASGVIQRSQRRAWRPTRLVLAGLVLALLVARVELGAVQLNGGLDGALAPDLIEMVWRFQSQAVMAMAAGAVLTGVGGRLASVLGALALSAGYGLGGHTRALETGPEPWIAAVHVLIAGVWIAAPLVLWPRAGVSDDRLAARLERFGLLARGMVPLLFIGGGWLAWRLTGGIEGLVGSPYGQLLLIKLAAAGIALALGAANAFLVGRVLAQEPARGRRWLCLTLGLDAALFAVALAMISAATSFVGPPVEG